MEPRVSYISPRLNEEALQHAIAYKLMFILGKDPSLANKHEWLNATLFAVRDRLVERWLRAHRARISQQARQVYYLSMEFLIGRTLSNALLSLGIYEDVKTALAGMGLDLEELIDEENDRAWATAVSVVWRPVFSTPSPRWGCQDAATASATTTACLSKTSSTAGRWSHRTTGWNTVTRGSSSAIKPAIPSALAGAFNMRAKTRAGWKPKRLLRWPTIRLSRVMKPMRPTPCVCGAPGQQRN
jgi:hypothetical protein